MKTDKAGGSGDEITHDLFSLRLHGSGGNIPSSRDGKERQRCQLQQGTPKQKERRESESLPPARYKIKDGGHQQGATLMPMAKTDLKRPCNAPWASVSSLWLAIPFKAGAANGAYSAVRHIWRTML
ncbi:hypothetical protein NAC44_10330 [Allorhizobium sp. BGMRC 0089]|uniref:hypothetical protein n=1 Tax=Allorhizobium sonneratiae TaxID=2934936 RepID=UPI002033607F|nr:hypothetical protein [Allorhizobium sonneratiae]MCM2292718.1 hypothetical protein [Allorhizobium sonneratiae]